MEEFIPYILILVGWHPDHPGDFSFKRSPIVFAIQAECDSAGVEAVEQRKIYHIEFGGEKFVYRCFPSASRAENDRAWQDMIDQRSVTDAPKP